jgi:hypothetical protein
MKIFFLMSVAALLLVACNKNQKIVKQLDGKWNATTYSYTWDGETEDLLEGDESTLTWDIDNCKLKDDEFCNISSMQTFTGGSYSEEFEYRVAGNGTSLELRNLNYPSQLTYIEIIEQSKTELVLEINEGGGDIINIAFEKE